MSDIYRELAALRDRMAVLEARESVRYTPKTAYTPVVTGGTTAGTGTYTIQTGHYWRIGALVFARGVVAWTAHTGTGGMRVSLPVTAATATSSTEPVVLRVENMTFASGWIEAVVNAGTAFFALRYTVSNAVSPTVDIEATGDIRFMAIYEAA